MHTFLFQYLPYIAGTLFVCGVTYRIAAQGKTVQAYSWASSSYSSDISSDCSHRNGPTTGLSPMNRSGSSPSSWAAEPASSPSWASVC